MIQKLVLFALVIAFLGSACDSGDGGSSDPICTPQEKKCDGNDVVKCNGDGSDWAFFKTCEEECAEGECIEVDPTDTTSTADTGEDIQIESDTGEDSYYGWDYYYAWDYLGGEDTYTGAYVHDWELVMIIDAEENTSGGKCNAGNPGADIDAVEIWRDGELFGWVSSVEAIEEFFSTPCDENDKDDPEEMLGPADGHCGDGIFSGYFALNGRIAYLLMSEIMENGDELVVYEMFNAENPDATIETYQVYLGFYNDEGDMAWTDEAVSDWNTGLIDGLW